MLQNATLALNHPDKEIDAVLYIPVLNFPMLPIQSGVQIVIPGLKEGYCEDFIITCYTASNIHGSMVYLEWDSSQADCIVVWEVLMQHAHKADGYIWQFSSTLDYGIKRST
jgi:hypothetical protein